MTSLAKSLALAAITANLTLITPALANDTSVSGQIKELMQRLEELEKQVKEQQIDSEEINAEIAEARKRADLITTNNTYGYEVLDFTTRINRKQQYILETRESGEILNDGTVTISGAIWADADYQQSNVSDKFGWLMRHPTFRNQKGNEVSHALIHSAQLSATYAANHWITLYGELLYDPEQSFGSGTITDVNRNQVQLRRGYVLFGDLEELPLYLSLGKMATPFGLTDTVNPFTASTVWHAFGGLAYGAKAGYLSNGVDISVMAVQGGAQFRAANSPVHETAVPSSINNYVANASYTHTFSEDLSGMVGASYQQGSAYCQDFPVLHFNPCKDVNPAFDIYTQWQIGDLKLIGEFAKTVDTWPGTLNPSFPDWEASRVTSFAVGARYPIAKVWGKKIDLSFEFSRFEAGPDGAPWHNQDQWVVGLQSFITPSVKVFAEYIHVNGYVPLNNVSDPRVSNADVKNGAGVIGVAAAF